MGVRDVEGRINKLKIMLKQILTTAIALIIVGGAYFAFAPSKLLGDVLNVPQPATASTTAFTLTTSSQRLLASSSARISAMIQTKYCPTDTQVSLKADSDKPAVANSGPMVFGTTTLAFNTFPETPVPTGAVTGITNAGTCTVIVTEWRKF